MNDLKIDYLGNHPEFSREIAELWTKEWSSEYLESEVDRRDKRNIEQYGSKTPPFILIAYNANGLIGTSALLFDDLKNRPEFSIWVGGVLVKPEFRNKGMGRQLVEMAVSKAKELGYSQIWLKTEHEKSFYENMGWQHVETTNNDDGTPTDVYTKKL